MYKKFAINENQTKQFLEAIGDVDNDLIDD